MKTILLIIIISSINVFSQWEKITYPPVAVSFQFAVNGDSIYAYRSYHGWFKSYNSGETWVKDDSLFIAEDGSPITSISSYPIFDNNRIYAYDKSSHSMQISYNYGKTFEKSNLIKTDYHLFDWVFSIIVKNNIVAVGGYNGFYISYDYGKNYYLKDKPGVIQYGGDGYSLDPEELGFHIASPANVDGILIKDDYILLTSQGRGPAIYKTVKYDLYDSLNTKYYNISYMYFVNKYGDKIAFEDYESIESRFLIEIEDRIFTNFKNSTSYDRPNAYSQIWYSDDEGETWNELNTEQFGLKHVLHITKCGDVLYATQKEGLKVFMSTDLGETWELFDKGFNEIPDENSRHLILGNLQFNDNYAFITNGWNLYRAPLKDCKIVTETSNVESATTDPKIYPNPASESITISGVGQGKIEIYNTLGQKLIEKEIFGTSTINTNDLQTGMYVIKIESGVEVVFEKVIVNR